MATRHRDELQRPGPAAELEAASAAVDQAIDFGYFPRLSLTGRYLKLSPIDDVDLTLAAAPTATPGRPIPLARPSWPSRS